MSQLYSGPRPLERLSVRQNAIYLDQSLHGENREYTIGFLAELNGPLDRWVFEGAVGEITQAHDALRIRLVVDGEAYQSIDDSASLPFEYLDYSKENLADNAAENYSQRLLGAALPLMGERLWAMSLIRVSADCHFWVSRFHHLIVDGFSFQLIIASLARAYEQLLDSGLTRHESGEALPQYRRHLVRERQYRVSAQRALDAEFWRGNLSGIPGRDFSLASAQSILPRRSQRMISWPVSGDQYRQIESLCRSAGCSAAHFLMALLGAYLMRLDSSSETVIGVMTHGRSDAAARHTVGMFSSVVPLRLRRDEQDSFSTLVKQASGAFNGSYRHQRLSLNEIQEAAEQSAEQCPRLCEATCSFEDFTADQRFGQAKLRVIATNRGPLQAPLSLVLTRYHQQTEQGIHLEMCYSDEVLTEEEGRLVQHRMAHLLDAICKAFNAPLSGLGVQSDEERTLVTRTFNQTERPFSNDKPVQAIIEESVLRRPEAIAVTSGVHSLTYTAFNERANQLARFLRSHGVGPDERVGIHMTRGIPMLLSMVAVLKAGGAYVPVDTLLPAQRQKTIVATATPLFVLTNASEDSFEGWGCPVLKWNALLAALAQESTENLDPATIGLTSRHLAYVIFTSGSTGEPKGVMVEHRQIVNFIESLRVTPGIAESDRVLALTTLAFDIAVLELLLPLACGAQVIIGDSDLLREPQRLQLFLRESQATILQATPITWRLLLEDHWPGDRGLKALCGGEALNQALATQLSANVRELWNLYGPTEATIWCSTARADRAYPALAAYPLGSPIANCQFYILDKQRLPVPIGVVGELCIGGECLARGYFNRPDLTEDRFSEIPIDGQSRRLYWTGDLARRRANGTLEYLGRNDFQIKLHGLRIELDEIEGELTRFPGIRQAVVVVRGDSHGGGHLSAYVRLEGSKGFDAEGIRQHLRARLPRYMVPTHIVPLVAFPLTHNGKIDRKSLSLSEVLPNEQPDPASMTDLERSLAALWEGLLPGVRVGRHDSFFDVGGHSLLAQRLMVEVRGQLGKKLTLRQIFDHPTVAQLALQLENSEAAVSSSLMSSERTGPWPLSTTQQRLWFVDQLEGHPGRAYRMSGLIRVRGIVDSQALQSALDSLLARHWILQMKFSEHDGEPTSLLAGQTRFDLSTLILDETQIQAAVARFVDQPFDLNKGPLIRGLLIKQNAQNALLVVSMHHIVSDGWSLSILAHEMCELYTAQVTGVASSLPPLPRQYFDYSYEQRTWLKGESFEDDLAYWVDRLKGAPHIIALPTDRQRQRGRPNAGGVVKVCLDARLTDLLRSLARESKQTLFMVLFSGFSVLIGRLSNAEDLVVGVAVANRSTREDEQLIGPFVNILPLRVAFQAEATVQEHLAHVREVVLQMQAHQAVPFERIVERLRPARGSRTLPVVQVVMVLQNTPSLTRRASGLELTIEEIPSATAEFDLTLSIREIGGALDATFNYAAALFDQETIEEWARMFVAVLEGMAESPAQTVGAISLLAKDERPVLLKTFTVP